MINGPDRESASAASPPRLLQNRASRITNYPPSGMGTNCRVAAGRESEFSPLLTLIPLSLLPLQSYGVWVVLGLGRLC